MKLVKMRSGSSKEVVGLLEGDTIYPVPLATGQYQSLQDLLGSNEVAQEVEFMVDRSAGILRKNVTMLPPIDQQEVWAAGVTYKRSQAARMEESESSASCYDKVYEAERPELFFKAAPHRVVGSGGNVRIRKDSKWNVPEPELTLVLNSRLDLVGFTIGNDMSSRDIEGENPLYLPQAKCYDGAAALGPCITLVDHMPAPDQITIRMQIRRKKEIIFDGATSVSQLNRTYEDLIQWLGRDNSFPNGVFLMTGTGIIPESDFTLLPKDRIDIAIDGIGVLSNLVVQG